MPDFAAAIAEESLILHYQPVVDLLHPDAKKERRIHKKKRLVQVCNTTRVHARKMEAEIA